MDARATRPSVDPRTSLALWLRAARAERKLSLDDVARVTKIQPRILEQLESGQLEGLPAEVFVRGFVKSFARCVGLSEGEALKRYVACAEAPPQSSAAARAFIETLVPAPGRTRTAAGTIPPAFRDAQPEAAAVDGAASGAELPTPDALPAASVEADASQARAPKNSRKKLRGRRKKRASQSRIPSQAASSNDALPCEPQAARGNDALSCEAQAARGNNALPCEAQAASSMALVAAGDAELVEEPAVSSATVAAAGSASFEPIGSPKLEPIGSPSAEAGGAPGLDAAGSESAEAVGSANAEMCGAPNIEVVGSASAETGGAASVAASSLALPSKTSPMPARVPWRRPAQLTAGVPVAPSLVIDDANPDLADIQRDERDAAKKVGSHRVSFLPPILLDRDERGGRQGGLTLAVILLLIAATLTLSYLMRQPSVSGDGITHNSSLDSRTIAALSP